MLAVPVVHFFLTIFIFYRLCFHNSKLHKIVPSIKIKETYYLIKNADNFFSIITFDSFNLRAPQPWPKLHIVFAPFCAIVYNSVMSKFGSSSMKPSPLSRDIYKIVMSINL